jgi:hypothetical protein
MLSVAYATPTDVEALWPVAQAVLRSREGDADDAIAQAAFDLMLLGLASGREGMAAHVMSLLPLALTCGDGPGPLYKELANTGLAAFFPPAEGEIDDEALLQALRTRRGDGSAGLAVLATVSDRAAANQVFAARLLYAAASSGRWSLVSAVLALSPDIHKVPGPRFSDEDALSHKAWHKVTLRSFAGFCRRRV